MTTAAKNLSICLNMPKLLHWFKSEILKSARDACAFHNFKQTIILCIWFYSTCTSSGMGILLLKYVEAILVVLALLALIGWFSFGAVPSLSPSPLPVWSSILFLMKILAHIINLSLICLEINISECLKYYNSSENTNFRFTEDSYNFTQDIST